jgi:hypothetical protein
MMPGFAKREAAIVTASDVALREVIVTPVAEPSRRTCAWGAKSNPESVKLLD